MESSASSRTFGRAGRKEPMEPSASSDTLGPRLRKDPMDTGASSSPTRGPRGQKDLMEHNASSGAIGLRLQRHHREPTASSSPTRGPRGRNDMMESSSASPTRGRRGRNAASSSSDAPPLFGLHAVPERTSSGLEEQASSSGSLQELPMNGLRLPRDKAYSCDVRPVLRIDGLTREGFREELRSSTAECLRVAFAEFEGRLRTLLREEGGFGDCAQGLMSSSSARSKTIPPQQSGEAPQSAEWVLRHPRLNFPSLRGDEKKVRRNSSSSISGVLPGLFKKKVNPRFPSTPKALSSDGVWNSGDRPPPGPLQRPITKFRAFRRVSASHAKPDPPAAGQAQSAPSEPPPPLPEVAAEELPDQTSEPDALPAAEQPNRLVTPNNSPRDFPSMRPMRRQSKQRQQRQQRQPQQQQNFQQRVTASEKWLSVVGLRDSLASTGSRIARTGSDLNFESFSQFSMRKSAGDLINSQNFEYFMFFLIATNAVMMGAESDYSSRNLEYATPLVFEAVELGFCVIFTLEVALRIFVQRSQFFFGHGYHLNIVDCFVVVLQVLMLCLSAILRLSIPNLNVLRLVRLVRLIRIVRAWHILREIGQVRSVIASVAASFQPLCGAVLILGLASYILSIYLIEVVMTARAQADPDDENFEQLGRYYGSLSICMLSLWQAISGGVDWGELCNPLIDHVSPFAGFLLALYIAFALLALMNTITGLFTDSALRIAKEDKDTYILSHLKHVFAEMDSDGNGHVSWFEFERCLQTSSLQELFALIGLDASEAECMFKLIDINETGIIDVDDFLSGCVRLRGEAKALDLLVFTRETRRQLHACFSQIQEMKARLEYGGGEAGDVRGSKNTFCSVR